MKAFLTLNRMKADFEEEKHRNVMRSLERLRRNAKELAEQLDALDRNLELLLKSMTSQGLLPEVEERAKEAAEREESYW